MASNYTSNYGLCQWQASDKVLRTEFNADNAKIDAAIAAVDGRVDSLDSSKASVPALDSLKSKVNTLSTTVSGQGDTLKLKGNCQITVSTYTGNGQDTRTHTFPRRPVLFFITGPAVIFTGYGSTYTINCAGSHGIEVTWSGNSATFKSISAYTSNNALAIGNSNNVTYRLTVLYDQTA